MMTRTAFRLPLPPVWRESGEASLRSDMLSPKESRLLSPLEVVIVDHRRHGLVAGFGVATNDATRARNQHVGRSAENGCRHRDTKLDAGAHCDFGIELEHYTAR